MKKELTFYNMVKVGEQYVPVKELSLKEQKAFGNYVRKKPMEMLGYIVENIKR